MNKIVNEKAVSYCQGVNCFRIGRADQYGREPLEVKWLADSESTAKDLEVS